MRGEARGPDGLGEGAAPQPLNNEGACRRGASGGAGGSLGLEGCGKALGTRAAAVGTVSGSRRDWLEEGWWVEGSRPAPQLAALGGGGSRLEDPGIRSPSLLRPPLGPRGLPPTAFPSPAPRPRLQPEPKRSQDP